MSEMAELYRAPILLASKPETVEVAVRKIQPETLGAILSHEILEVTALECSGQEVSGGTL